MPNESIPQTDIIRLKHMRDAALEAMSFAQGIDRITFESRRVVIMAIIAEIQVIGESASKISESTRNEHSEIPWRAIIDMHNRLIHGYFDVDVGEVWSTLADDLPVLITQLQNILPDDGTL